MSAAAERKTISTNNNSLLLSAHFALDDPMRVLYDKHSRSQQPESKRVISALLAICSVITEKNMQPSPVSVYAATMASLTSVVDDTTFSSNASGELSLIHI